MNEKKRNNLHLPIEGGNTPSKKFSDRIVVFCVECGCEMPFIHHNKKFCDTCIKFHNAEIQRNWRDKSVRYKLWRKRYNRNLLGTGAIGMHKCDNVKDEKRIVRNELNRILSDGNGYIKYFNKKPNV